MLAATVILPCDSWKYDFIFQVVLRRPYFSPRKRKLLLVRVMMYKNRSAFSPNKLQAFVAKLLRLSWTLHQVEKNSKYYSTEIGCHNLCLELVASLLTSLQEVVKSEEEISKTWSNFTSIFSRNTA